MVDNNTGKDTVDVEMRNDGDRKRKRQYGMVKLRVTITRTLDDIKVCSGRTAYMSRKP